MNLFTTYNVGFRLFRLKTDDFGMDIWYKFASPPHPISSSTMRDDLFAFADNRVDRDGSEFAGESVPQRWPSEGSRRRSRQYDRS